jgi:hypothetical protein
MREKNRDFSYSPNGPSENNPRLADFHSNSLQKIPKIPMTKIHALLGKPLSMGLLSVEH